MLMPNIRADYRRYLDANGGPGRPVAAARALLEYGFIASVVYRYGRWTRTIRPKPLSYPFKLVYSVLSSMCEILFGIHIGTNADIGPGLYIGHFGGIFLVGDMGANCSVGQGVTIGFKGGGKSTRPPRLGNNVYVGTSAVIVGAIDIGDGAVIGANTTVVKDVPPGYTVVSQASRMFPPRDLA